MGPYLDIFAEAVKLTSVLLWRHKLGSHDYYEGGVNVALIVSKCTESCTGLRRYTQLKVLDLGTCNWNIAWMMETLSNVRSHKMRRLSLTLRSHETSLETVIRHWSESGLDDVLSAAPFLGLEQFDLILYCSGFSHDAARVEIVRTLPQCHARGILRLDIKPCEYFILRRDVDTSDCLPRR